LRFLYTSLPTFRNSGSDRYNCINSRHICLFSVVRVCVILKRRCERYENQWWTGAMVESSWNVMAHGDAREGKWRGNWRMECVASTLHTTSEHGVFSITTADAHTSAASSRLKWRPRRFKWTRPFRLKTKCGSARVTSHFKRSLHQFTNMSIHAWNSCTTWLLCNKIQTCLYIVKLAQSNYTTHNQTVCATDCVCANFWPCVGPFRHVVKQPESILSLIFIWKICPASFCETCQWLKYPLNGLRAQRRESPVVGLLPLASG